MVSDDTLSMAASLSSRAAPVVRRSTSISSGAIAGATIGSVVGASLIFLCLLPFILRARRQRAARLRDGDQEAEEIGNLPAASFFPRPHFGDAFLRNHFAPGSGPGPSHTPTSVKEFDVEGGPDSPCQNESSIENPQQPSNLPGVYVEHGLPSPISSPLPATASFPPPSGWVGGRSPTADAEASVPTSPLQPSGEVPGLDAAAGFRDQSTGSYGPQATTLLPEDITEEPEAIVPGGALQRHSSRRSSHLSDTVRQLARRASAAIRRASTTSTGERSMALRSPSIGPGDILEPTMSAPATFEPVDTEARGEAYSYYHDVDGLPAPTGPYGPPPLSISTSCAPPPPPGQAGIFTSPTQIPTVTPISPVSPVAKPVGDVSAAHGFSQWTTSGDDSRGLPDLRSPSLRKKRAFPEPIQRMDSLPLQGFMSDIPSPPLPPKAEPSVNPMDIMKPSTDTEMGWMVNQELVKMASSPPPPADQAAGAMLEPPGQPTPDPTPDPTPEPESKPPPEIEINGQDVQMREASVWSTPRPSSGISNYTSPDNTPDSRPTPYSNTPSPRSNDGGSYKPDSSPRLFPCEECHRVFDQFHKLK